MEKRLYEILEKRSGIRFMENPKLCREKLLGRKIKMPARELLNVFFDVEQEFGITIPEEEILKGHFDTAEDVMEIIKRRLSHEAGNY